MGSLKDPLKVNIVIVSTTLRMHYLHICISCVPTSVYVFIMVGHPPSSLFIGGNLRQSAGTDVGRDTGTAADKDTMRKQNRTLVQI